ncbi:amidase [Pseudooceanicola nanhaiensis]|uniref:amidase n=1 Tax=Pseudooceanicola nanhaiensis TaxID=375761 RepID=UPI001CD44F9F|nr:amidase [Pseudooceanicola nanhaiensis]MCA0921275.1 amidase [Pseudooceanicola nanhaiensis]
MTLDPRAMTARGIAKAVNAGDVTAVAVTEAYLDRINVLEAQVQAFAYLDPKRALDEAAAVDAGAKGGLLSGVPLAVKDVIDSADMPTAYGSDAYTGFRPGRDATCMHLARMAGAVALGKTVTTEFATMSPGPTRNPFNPGHTPGGSSSGSAAALGAAMASVGFGTQTSGSTIRPSGFCGVAGFKASLNRIDRTGVKPLGESLDVVGAMARDVRDAALLAAVIAREPSWIVPEETPDLPAVALFLPEQEGPALEAGGQMAIDRVAALLAAPVAMATPAWWDGLGPAQDAVFGWEASASLAVERDLRAADVTEITRGFMARQALSTAEGHRAGCAARDAALADLDSLFGAAEILITPPASGEAPAGLGSTGNAAFNIRWTLLGTPSITVPAGLGPTGLPVAVQVVARPGQDALLLHAAAAIEDALRRAGHPARPEI